MNGDRLYDLGFRFCDSPPGPLNPATAWACENGACQRYGLALVMEELFDAETDEDLAKLPAHCPLCAGPLSSLGYCERILPE